MKFSEVCFILFFGFISYGVGVQEIPVYDPNAIRLSKLALVEINKSKYILGNGELVKIISASRLLVFGSLTRLVLEVKDGANLHQFIVEIWDQSWWNRTKITIKEHNLVINDNSGTKEYTQTVEMFYNFLKTHNKVYADEKEYKKRYLIFKANLNEIKLLQESERGTAQYGPTWFSDLTTEEFKRYLGFKTPETKEKIPSADIPNIELPKNFDWRHYNVVTPVKSQHRDCGSCWAFSTTGNIEGQWALKKGKLLSLSEQELVDCDTGDNGCNGGYPPTAFKAIMKLGGLETETEYPYEGIEDICHFNKTQAKVQISGWVRIRSNEVKMAKWLVKSGPMSASLNADVMHHYIKGVSHPGKHFCNPFRVNHVVLIVGYGVEVDSFNNTLPFWIIKNSWGKDWGEDGYYRLYRGDGSCGINKYVFSAVVS